MTHVTCRLTAKNRYQLRNPTLGNRVSYLYLLLPVAVASVAVARSSGGVVIRYVFPVLWTTSYLHIK